MTNATYATNLCTRLEQFNASSGLPTSITLRANSDGLLRNLPECFWDYTESAATISISSLIIYGNSNGSSEAVGYESSDPLLRFPNTVGSLTLLNCVFVNPNTSSNTPDLQGFLTHQTTMATLSITSTPINLPLFEQLPANFRSLTIKDCGLTGSISSDFLAAYSTSNSLLLNLASNRLNGSLPTFLAQLPVPTSLGYLTMDLHGNQLSGSLPVEFFPSAMTNLQTAVLLASGNQLSGTVPSEFFGGGMNLLSYVYVDMSNNSLTGISATWALGAINSLASQCEYHFGNNKMAGEVPPFFANYPALYPSLFYSLYYFPDNQFSSINEGAFPNGTTGRPGNYVLDLSRNQFGGSLSSIVGTLPTIAGFELYLTENQITGTIPSAWMANFAEVGRLYQIKIDLSLNRLSGTVPDQIFANMAPENLYFNVSGNSALTGSLPSSLSDISPVFTDYTFIVDFSRCSFSGSIPQMMMPLDHAYEATILLGSNQLTNGSFSVSSFVSSSATAGPAKLLIDISRNAFAGKLDLTGFNSAIRTALLDNSGDFFRGFIFNASGNNFTEIAMDDSVASTAVVFDISHNPKLTTGALLASIFSEVLFEIHASNTGLKGSFPDIATLNLPYITVIDFSDNRDINFCASGRSEWNVTTLSSCLLIHTSANDCADLYPSNCEISAIPPMALEPVTVPAVPSSTTPGPRTPTRGPTGASSKDSTLSIILMIVSTLIFAMNL